ncbi:S26 family signal peptidase [Phytohabitans kaempferiae]|uniref:signal peptidase I n=1 Tax=Phytohabitans kaempferiae TaxID=1620943 RepID=A0ABV6MAA5_9ACTN
MTTVLIAAAAAVMALGAVAWWLRQRLRIVTVAGNSMHPTLASGDRLLVRRTRLTRVRVGDIVVVDLHDPELGGAPPDDGRWLIKRAAAIHGDPVPASVATVLSIPPGAPVPGGSLVIIGDNLAASYDSRNFGYVSAGRVFGVAVRRIGSTRRGLSSNPATAKSFGYGTGNRRVG